MSLYEESPAPASFEKILCRRAYRLRQKVWGDRDGVYLSFKASLPDKLAPLRSVRFSYLIPLPKGCYFWVPNGDGQYRKYDLDLTDKQWENLRSLALSNGSFSESGLGDVGFSTGPHGQAREVNERLKEAEVLVMDGKRLVAIPEFRDWLKNYQWRE